MMPTMIEPASPSSKTPVQLVTVDDNHDGQRIDNFLFGQLKGVPRTLVYRILRKGEVRVNKGRAKPEHKLAAGDVVRIPPLHIPEPDAPAKASGNLLEVLESRILFEDQYLIAINKPAGLAVHGGSGIRLGLIEALRQMRPQEKMLELVHRLDRDTSGLMLAAKDDDTQRALQNLIRTRTLDRRYITLVHGHIAMDEGTINTGIARSTRDRVKMAVSDDPFARQAITTFKVLERFDSTRFDDGYTLVECHLFTGRTHQIRVHMRHINHACVGDPLYGKCDARADQGLTRQFLHSWRVAFDHPVTGERIECRDELPWDLAAVLDDLAPRSLGRTAAGDEIVPQLGLLEA